ncbi:MAG: hypothetical protein AB7U73_17400 [Pirellulales bacterium]
MINVFAICVALATSLEPASPVKIDAAAETTRLVSARKDARLRAKLPEVEDPEVAKLLDDPRLILYTEAEMPRAYQFWDGVHPGVHSAYYNISANGSEPYGNANREFPWGHPAGTQKAKGVSSFRFLWLPLDEKGKTLPVVWYRKQLSGGGRSGYAWTFPAGAVLGEVLMLESPAGEDYVFEVRIRRRELDDWAVDVFRPFPTAGDLAARVRELRPDWASREKLATLCDHLDEARKLPVSLVRDRQPGKRTFSQRMGVDTLPSVGDDALVVELLTTTPFRSAISTAWRVAADDTHTCAPTTKARFHVVPAGYSAGHIEVEQASCRRCHNTVNHSVDEFDGGRDWYGRVRGSDGIFSFHPFSRSSISDNGFPRTVSIRKELTKSGVVAHYNPKKHSDSVYRKTKHFEP